jgi:hypothetical protein
MSKNDLLALLAMEVLISVAAGRLAGFFFDLSVRQQVFPAAVVFGLGILWLVRRSRSQEPPVVSSSRPGRKLSGMVDELIKSERALSEDEAREWLDAFLMRQQK